MALTNRILSFGAPRQFPYNSGVTANWNRLEDALGSAARIPELLRALADPEKERRVAARFELSARVWYGGQVTPASVEVVGPLLALAADPALPEREEVLLLERRIALGLHEGLEGEALRDVGLPDTQAQLGDWLFGE